MYASGHSSFSRDTTEPRLDAPPTEVGICIFLSRERHDVAVRTLGHVQAAAPASSVVDLVVNGNLSLAVSMAEHIRFAPRHGWPRTRVWTIGVGDKANAWNVYLHQIWAGESIACFMDGYVRPYPDAIRALVQALKSNEAVLGATGVPTVGRTATRTRQQMQNSGGFHGNLCCVRGSAVEEIRANAIRLPLGLYRTDSLMGALLCFGVDSTQNAWDVSRIAVLPDASWEIDAKHWWRASDLLSHWKRTIRQARGVFENRAVKSILAEQRLHPASLPRHASTLVKQWAARHPREYALMVMQHPLALPWLVSEAPAEPPAALEPRLLSDSESL
jgi:hypothetical protein